MSDFLLNLSSHPWGKRLAQGVGLPSPQSLARANAPYSQDELARRRVVLGAVAEAGLTTQLRATLVNAGANVLGESSLGSAGVNGVVFDTTALKSVFELRACYDFFHPLMSRIKANARVVIIAAVPEQAINSSQQAARRAVEGFARSIAKEIGKRGATANLLYVEQGAEDRIEGPLRFLLSARSTFVDGQPIRISTQTSLPAHTPFVLPLEGKVALVTGAARGLGAAAAERLAEEGAMVVCLDVPGDEETLRQTAKRVGGLALPMDVTSIEAPQEIAAFLKRECGGVDLVVHNAGVTRDKTLAKMDEHLWDLCLAVNLEAIVKIDEALVGDQVLRNGGRVVCLSSIAGIAGNVGQTNYAATKAGVIGYVAGQGKRLAECGITVNAVAPGLIETRMMMAMPFFFREVARRINSLSQGGVPRDAGELITFLCTPGAAGINGQTIRLCGQSLIGA